MKTESTKKSVIVGLGGAGSNIVEYLHKNDVKANFICISNPERPNLSPNIHFEKFVPPQIPFGERSQKTIPFSDMNQPLILPQNIKKLFTTDNKYILLAGLGGYTGTYMVEQLTDLFKQNRTEFAVICSLPFSFEGETRKEIVRKTTLKLSQNTNSRCVKHEALTKQYGDKPFDAFMEALNHEFLLVINSLDLKY